MMLPRPYVRRIVVLALGLSFAGVCAMPAPAVSPASAPRELSMAEKRKIIAERAKALADMSNVSAKPSSWKEQYANEAIEGVIHFEGDITIKTGLKNIDWDGGQYGNIEWGQSLNRFFHLDPLASMYLRTHDERYAQAARAYIEDWIRACKGGFPKNDTVLSLALRLNYWEATLAACLDSKSFDDPFVQSMLDSISSQIEYQSHNLRGTNFRVAQLDSLIQTPLRLPFLPNAKEVLAKGVNGMQANLATQFLPDGVHVERTPGYHGGMVEMAIKYMDLGKRFPEAAIRVDPELVKRAIDYSAQSSLSAFNDTGIVYRDPQEKDQRPEQRWVAQMESIFPKAQIPATPPLEQVFPYAGHVFARSAWKPGADYLAFDAGTWGSGHDHLSRLGFTFRASGRVLVADPGCFSYEMSDPVALYGRSTPAHSTLNLNGLNQSNVDAQLLRVEFSPATALIHGRYQGGYWPGTFHWSFGGKHGNGVAGTHDRTLVWIKGEYLVALDTMTADPQNSVHNVWQMGPMEAWEKDESKLAWWSRNKDENLYLQMAGFGGETKMLCYEGSKQPVRGWVAKEKSIENMPAPQVEFQYASNYVTPSAVLLVPYAGEQRPAYAVKRTGQADADEPICELEVSLPDGGTDLIAWSGSLTTAVENMPSSLDTDATFVWLRRDAAGKPVKGYLLDGSFVYYQGKLIYEAAKREAKLVQFGQ